MKLVLAAAASSAFSFCARARHSFRRVRTISASLLRETVALWANKPLANVQVRIATVQTATGSCRGYPPGSEGGSRDQKVVARNPRSRRQYLARRAATGWHQVLALPELQKGSVLPVKCMAAMPEAAIAENSTC